MKYRTSIVILLLVSVAPCAARVLAATLTVDIEAYIDGRDRLIIQGDEMRWNHFEFGAVGRAGSASYPTIVSTALDGVPVLDRLEWFPEWSAPPPTPIRQPELSRAFTGLLPSAEDWRLVNFEAIDARTSVALVQQPQLGNGYTTVVEFNDNGSDGAAWYHTRLTFDSAPAPVPPQVLRWQFEATLTDVDNLNGVLGDARLGDPLRGELKYDPSRPASLIYNDKTFYGYLEPSWFGVASVVLENPRTGGKIVLAKEVDVTKPGVAVVNNDMDGTGISALQYIARPGDSEPGELYIELFAPPSSSFDPSLPVELNLEDWPLTRMEYLAFDFEESSFVLSEYLYAEIHTLTPITTPLLPGDYDYDDDIDAGDYGGWKASFGFDRFDLYADGNANGIVDAADYVVWRKSLSQATAHGSGAHAVVPEPSTVLLCLLGFLFRVRRINVGQALPDVCCRRHVTPPALHAPLREILVLLSGTA